MREIRESRVGRRRGERMKKKVYIRPIGDGNSIVYYEDKDGYEVQLDTPKFEEYGEAAEWCAENGYDWEEEE